MSVFEKYTTIRQGVDVRGRNARIAVEATDPVIHIVDADQKDIRFFIHRISGPAQLYHTMSNGFSSTFH